MTCGWMAAAALLSLGVVVVAYRVRALSVSGALAAWGVGTLALGFGGPVVALSVILFFTSSTVLTRLGTRRKAPLVNEYAKGGRRDWGQVLGNGGIAAALALVLAWARPEWRTFVFYALVGALAAATADTWATEVGGLFPSPRLLTTGARVPPGTSGAVTWQGVLISLIAGVTLGGSAAALTHVRWPVWNPAPRVHVLSLAGWGSLAGGMGSLFDSWLGATVQAMYYCARCNKHTERAIHTCGAQTRHIRGWRWMSNDVVNFAATLLGSIMGLLGSVLQMSYG